MLFGKPPVPARALAALIVGLIVVKLSLSSATAAPASPPIPTCATLAKNPVFGIAGNHAIKSATSVIVPPAKADVGYCKVSLLYGTNPNQNINIVIGLPLSLADGGSGGIQGAWNGRTQGLGGGGCAGNLIVTPAVDAGYVGSGTDLGHAGGDCEPGVNADGSYNLQFIEDFIRNAIKQQVLWSKKLANTYYNVRPAFNYWNGCSTGGRQGYLLAQELGDELEGIVANAPAIYWTRFQTAQMWGQMAMQELVGGPISPMKLEQTRAAAVAACDAADGLADGIINDPRGCHFDARANICGAKNAPVSNCLTSEEANAVNLIWDGPRNLHHDKIWFGLDRGSDFSILDGTNPFFLGVTQFHWDEHDRNFDWRVVTPGQYPQVAQDGSRNIADVTDTFAPLDTFRAHGGKMVTFVGANDQFIYPRGVINYYRTMALRYSRTDRPDFERLQRFYRLFDAPGVGHCGIGSTGPVPVDPFGALVKWVEKGVAPDSLLAAGGSAAPASGRTRPVCAYPQTAIYNGRGSTDDAANFYCGGNLEKRKVVCADVLVKYKNEEHGGLSFRESGVDPESCRAHKGFDLDQDEGSDAAED